MSSLRLALKQSLQDASAEGVVLSKKKKTGKSERRKEGVNHDGATTTNNYDSDSSEENEASLHDLEGSNDEDSRSSEEEDEGPNVGTVFVVEHKQKQQHSAAHKIQNQFRKKNCSKRPPSSIRTKKKKKKKQSASKAATGASSLSKFSQQQNHRASPGSDGSDDEEQRQRKQKHSKSKSTELDSDDSSSNGSSRSTSSSYGSITKWTVPAPSEAVVQHMRLLSVAAVRAHVTLGLRVKVHFDRKAWYGGRVSAVSKKRSRIRIEYDDGTNEIAPFPDISDGKDGNSSVDIVVDAVDNGQHAATATEDARIFVPPAVLSEPSHETADVAIMRQSLESKEDEQFKHETPESLEPKKETPKHEGTSLELKKEQPKPLEDHPLVVDVGEPSKLRHLDSEEEGELVKPSIAALASASAVIATTDSMPVVVAVLEKANTVMDDVPLPSTVQSPNDDCAMPMPPGDMGSIVEPLDSKLHSSAVEARRTSPAAHSKEFVPLEETPADFHLLVEESPQHEDGLDEPPKPKRKRGRPPKQRPTETTEVQELGGDDAQWTETDPTDVQRETKQPEPPLSWKEPRSTDDAVESYKFNITNAHPLTVQGDINYAPDYAVPANRFRSSTGSLPHLKIRMPKSTGEFAANSKHAKSPRTPRSPAVASENSEHARPLSPTLHNSNNSPQSSPRSRRFSGEMVSHKSAAAGEPLLPPPKKLSIRIPVHKVMQSMHEAGMGSPFVHKHSSIEQAAKANVLGEGSNPRLDIAALLPRVSVEVKKANRLHEVNIAAGGIELHSRAFDFANKSSAAAGPMSPKLLKHQKKLKKRKLLAAAVAEAEELLKQKNSRMQQHTQRPAVASADGDSYALPVTPRLDLPVASTDVAIEKELNTPGGHDHPTIIGSKNSAFVGKEENSFFMDVITETTEGNSSIPSNDLGKLEFMMDGSVRSERRAAQQANERIVTKQDAVALPEQADIGKKKKKRDRRKDAEGGGSQSGGEESEDDSQWVQCDKCAKWRIIPSSVVQMLPKQWYCADNIYDTKRASCEAPEQTAKQVAKEKKRMKKRQRMMKAAAAAAAAEGTSPHKPDSNIGAEATSRKEKVLDQVRSPRPPRDPLDDPEKPFKPPKSSSPIDETQALNAHNDARPRKEKKASSLLGKKGRSVESIEKLVENEPAAEASKPRGRGRPRRTQIKESLTTAGSTGPSTTDDAENLEWVQCENCDKWRKLPPHVSADDLPDVWTCNLNDWNPTSASCEAPEDKAEGLQDIGVFGSSGSNVGKLTFRHLIFGSTGRKANRPVSERTRAAESLFATQFDEDEAPSKVLYSDSSVYVSRGRPSISLEENEGMSVLELMSHSQLWRELRGVPTTHSSGSILSTQARMDSYIFDTLPSEAQQLVKDFLWHVLDVCTLSGEDVVLRAKSMNVDLLSKGLQKAQMFCTKNVVITTLCELVKVGKVDCIQKIGTNCSVYDWNPLYRRRLVKGPPPVELQSTKERVRKDSRCMKISKPWKRTKM